MKPQLANTLYDPDATASPAVARHLDFVDYAAEVPVHTHRKGQLIIARYGAVSCYAENDIWIVPPDCAVWMNRRKSFCWNATNISPLPTAACLTISDKPS